MVGVLGPIENLEQCVRAVVEKSNIDGLDVVVNDECSLQKYIEDNGWDLPRRVRDYAIGQKEIAVCGDTTEEYSKLFGLIRGTRAVRKAVVSLVYPYFPDCVVVVDNAYLELGKSIREVIAEFERKAIPIF